MGLFVASYAEALSAPKPHEVPFGVAGGANLQLVNRIEQQAGTALKIKRYKTEADMRDAIDQQDIFGALEVNGNQATLFVASASGSGAAKLFEGAAPAVAKRLGVKVTVKDLKPLPKSDPNGLTVFYVALGCIIYGFTAVTIALGAGHRRRCGGWWPRCWGSRSAAARWCRWSRVRSSARSRSRTSRSR